jgi:hypothetical protein
MSNVATFGSVPDTTASTCMVVGVTGYVLAVLFLAAGIVLAYLYFTKSGSGGSGGGGTGGGGEGSTCKAGDHTTCASDGTCSCNDSCVVASGSNSECSPSGVCSSTAQDCSSWCSAPLLTTGDGTCEIDTTADWSSTTCPDNCKLPSLCPMGWANTAPTSNTDYDPRRRTANSSCVTNTTLFPDPGNASQACNRVDSWKTVPGNIFCNVS